MNNNKMRKLTKRERKQQNRKKGLLLSCAVLSSCFVLSSVASASDIEVYHQSSVDQKTIMLMVDTSRAMGSSALDLMKEYPLCIGGGILSLLNLNIAGLTVNLSPASNSTDGQYCDIILDDSLLATLANVDGLTGSLLNGVTGNSSDLLGLKSSYDYVKKSCEPIQGLLGNGYRCYSRLYRIRKAVNDVLNGNADKGITALPADTYVGLTVFPATTKSSAGMIAVPAQRLGDIGSTQRQALMTAVSNLEPASLDATTTCVKTLLTATTLDLTKIGEAASCLLGGGLAGGLDALLNKAEVPTAPAYAETGAYLLGRTTRHTGAKVVGSRIAIELTGTVQTVTDKFFCSVQIPVVTDILCRIAGGVLKPVLSPVTNIVDKLGANLALSRTCTANAPETGECTAWGNFTLSSTNNFTYDYEKKRSLVNGLVEGVDIANLVGGMLPGSIVTGLIPKNLDNLETYYYQYDAAYDAAYSGFTDSVSGSKGSTYNSPLPVSSQCNANGIYVITGNVPRLDESQAKIDVQRVMQKSLNVTSTKIADYCTSLPTDWATGSNKATWECLAKYSSSLLDNPTSIKTAVASIGREFTYVSVDDNNNVAVGVGGDGLVAKLVSTLVNPIVGTLSPAVKNLLEFVLPIAPNSDDIGNLARWGVNGGGGWYAEASTGGIAQGILDFHGDLGVTEYEPFLGAPTIPADPLTPHDLKNDVYQNMFVPSDKQSWFGNLKKYTTQDGETIQTKNYKDIWGDNNIDQTNILTGGSVDRLPIAHEKDRTAIESARRVYINRSCTVEDAGGTKTGKYEASDSLNRIGNEYYKEACEGDFDPYRKDLMALLGYDIVINDGSDALKINNNYRKVGMPLHSTPIKITQEATFEGRSLKQREDYIIFGSTQGLLHVVYAEDHIEDGQVIKGGTEKFTFVPNEMLENDQQRKAFKGNNLSGHGSFGNMQYGIDGAWTAYTEYVWNNTDKKWTVEKAGGQACEKDGKEVQGACGKQYIYGGLRMGGRSYYALDLGDLSQPKLKFHIDPDNAKDGTPLSYMGQSWSKPTISHVNWKGSRKRVMIVGGGYDLGYENKDYNQANKKGAGIYMFDADSGDLLWWASANATNINSTSAESTQIQGLKVDAMQYSVVSRINAIDRDGDGTTDHLYFGDLGGQLWRIDLNNHLTSTAITPFAQASKLLDLKDSALNDTALADIHVNTRFYEAPNFSVYGHGSQTRAVISIASSNRSLPISDNSAGAIFNIFDNEVVKLNPADNTTLGTKKLHLHETMPTTASKLEDLDANLREQGWYVKLSNEQKVMDEMTVMNKKLYASVFDPKVGEPIACTVGVKGTSYIRQYCLPYGICEQQDDTNYNGIDGLNMGKGIIPVTIGAGTGVSRQIVGGDNRKGESSIESVSKQQNVRRQIVPLKWYESNE